MRPYEVIDEEKKKMSIVKKTKEYIEYNSVSALSNLALAQRLQDDLEAQGFETTGHRRLDARGIEKINLIARKADRFGRIEGGLMLAGHMDTVPFRPDQKATLAAFQEGGVLYGRGSCDMKGAIAAQIEAAARFAKHSLERPLTLAFTSDEEVGCLGAKALLGTSLLQSRYAIVGEPTSLKPVRMHKGYFGAEITLHGTAAHSSRPRQGRSVIKAAARMVLGLEALEAELERELVPGRSAFFQPECATINIGIMSAGTARNVVPEDGRWTLEYRPLPGQDAQRWIARFEARIQEIADASGIQATIEWNTHDAPMETPETSPLVAFCTEVTGHPAGAVAFSTEGKEYNQMGMESVILGPGSIDKAHQEDEFVPLDELEASVDIYAAAIERFCMAPDE